MSPEEELQLRRDQLAAREGKYGFQQNVADLKKRIAELEGEVQ